MQLGDRRFAQRGVAVGQVAHPGQRVLVVEHLQMVADRLAADRDAVLDQLPRFGRGERVALDRRRGVGQLEIVIEAERRDGAGRERAPGVQLGLEPLDLGHAQNADSPVIARPRIRAWTSWAPS